MKSWTIFSLVIDSLVFISTAFWGQLLSLCTVFCFPLILLRFISYYQVELLLGLALLSFIVGLYSLSQPPKTKSIPERPTRRIVKAMLPTALHLLTLFAVVVIPWSDLFRDLEFQARLPLFEELIARIKSGEIDHEIPAEYNYLKQGSRIDISHKDNEITILYYTVQGVSSNYSGFYYTSSDHPRYSNSSTVSVRKIQPHWYYIMSSD